MSPAEQMGDALRLMGRAVAYHRTFVANFGAYYALPAVRTSAHLAMRAAKAMQAILMDDTDPYRIAGRSPDEVRLQAEALARQLEWGALLCEAVERPISEQTEVLAAEGFDYVRIPVDLLGGAS